LAHEVEEKLESILAGDPEAAAWLYDIFASRLGRRLGSRYPDLAAELEDLVHDVFVLFLRPEGDLVRTFLDRRTPTRSALERRLWDLGCGLASNRRRSSRRRKVVHLDDRDRTDPIPDAERCIIDRDRLQRLDACLRRANPRIYLYFKLRYRDGLSPEEIAEATGWSRKATYKLKQALNEEVKTCADALGLDLPS
jgi:DNA-directed RNA polymerase specialized sigma24 family protein